ncbi:MAG: hypothetical protein LBR10_08125 [Prevotellaceae bacterium]|jgi:hypothetical protein|nr:hypothetical protein [Prevotellaceae bacterium]
MRKVSVWIAASIFAISVLFVGCNDNNDDGPGSTTVAEDKENIQASFDRIKNILQKFHDGSLYRFAEEFIDYHEEYVESYSSFYYYVGDGNGDYTLHLNYNAGEYEYEYEYTPGTGDYAHNSYGYYDDVISDFATLLSDKLQDVIDLDDIEENGRFNFASFAGQYTWDNSRKEWNKTSHNTILALFPSSENGATNNCELGITEYTDKACDIEGETIYLPTKVSASFKKDAVKLASVDVTADYTNYGIPKQATAKVYAKPVNIEAALIQESASKYSASLSVADEDNQDNNLSISCTATLSNGISNYTDLDDCELNNLRVAIAQSDLTVNGSVDIKTLNNINEPSVTDINNCISFEVLYRNQIIGTLKVEEVGDEVYLFIIYKDGTKENTSIYYDSFIEDIESIFEK